jgi:P-type E1-E2 ATPase
MSEQKAEIPAQIAAAAEAMRAAGDSVSFLADAGHVIAAIGFQDAVRPEAAATLKALRDAGARTVLLTGDHEAAARRVAAALGIEEVHAGLSPGAKLEHIDRLKAAGVVAMVGDGINDAPALARAHVGVAIAEGSDVAKETGDVVLRRLADLPQVLDIGRRSLRAIRQNLFLSLVYNAIGIPLAAGALVWAGVFLPPSFAALAMVFSDLSVAGNSARLALELRKKQA